jgi:hypothetical protein
MIMRFAASFLVGLFDVFTVAKLTYHRMPRSYELGRKWKEEVIAYFKVLPYHLTGGLEEIRCRTHVWCSPFSITETVWRNQELFDAWWIKCRLLSCANAIQHKVF